MKNISFDYSGIMEHVTVQSVDAIMAEVENAKKVLDSRSGAGNDFLGWLDIPVSTPESEIKTIEETAAWIRENSEIFIVIGIGGSYLGARAALSALRPAFANELALCKKGNAPAVYFAGCDMSGDYMASLLDLIKNNKKVTVNVISKSGTTTEPAIALRILFEAMVESMGYDEAKKRFIATTDKARGALKGLADKEGWKTFVIEDDVGGRFSVLTAVGLLPMAVAGIDIRAMIEGAKAAVAMAAEKDLRKNVPCMYAAVRNILYRKGRAVELLASFEPGFHYLGEWWKQLYGESEGKDNKGIYPDSLDFSTDLHSMGQYIQQGVRMLMETFLLVEKPAREVLIPKKQDDADGLNYIAGKSLHYVNSVALEGTAKAHRAGDVPVLQFTLPEMNAYYLGQLFYIFEYACGVSGYLLGVNPFDQPGVESYKKNMFALLGKSGFEQLRDELLKGSADSSAFTI